MYLAAYQPCSSTLDGTEKIEWHLRREGRMRQKSTRITPRSGDFSFQITGIERAMTGGETDRTGMEERERAAREWLEGIIAKSQSEDAAGEAVWKGGFFDALSLSGLRISRAQAGRALCFFRVPAHLTVTQLSFPLLIYSPLFSSYSPS